MSEQTITQKIEVLSRKRAALLERLVPAARAAANQMKDAGMHRGADPLHEILFRLDGLDAELMALIESDPGGVGRAVLSALTKSREE